MSNLYGRAKIAADVAFTCGSPRSNEPDPIQKKVVVCVGFCEISETETPFYTNEHVDYSFAGAITDVVGMFKIFDFKSNLKQNKSNTSTVPML